MSYTSVTLTWTCLWQYYSFHMIADQCGTTSVSCSKKWMCKLILIVEMVWHYSVHETSSMRKALDSEESVRRILQMAFFAGHLCQLAISAIAIYRRCALCRCIKNSFVFCSRKISIQLAVDAVLWVWLLQWLQVYDDGTQTRSFQYVDDLIIGLIALMNSNYSGPINLGNPREHTITEMAQIIKQLAGMWLSFTLPRQWLFHLVMHNFSTMQSLILVYYYCIYSRISQQFLAQFWCSSCGCRLIRLSCHTARVSMTAISQPHSLCVCRTWRGPLVGH